MIASVIGSVIVNFVPIAELAADVDDAAELADVRLDDVHADAAAGQVGDRARVVEKPGRKIRLKHLVARQLARLVGVDDAALDGASGEPRRVDAGAVVPTSMTTWLPFW